AAGRAEERREHRTALFDRGQLVRTGLVEVGEVRREGGREVGGPVAELGHLVGEVAEGRVLRGGALERPTRFADERGDIGAVVFARERFVRGRRRETQLFGVCEALGALRELLVLPGLRCCLL